MKVFKKTILILVLTFLTVGLFTGAYLKGKQDSTVALRKKPQEVTIYNKQFKHAGWDFSLYWDVWDKVTEKYLLRPVDQQKMKEGSMKGITGYLQPKETSQSSQSSGSKK